MKKAIAAILMTFTLTTTAACGSQSPAESIGCEDYVESEGGAMVETSGICYLDNKRVNLITFANDEQQDSWNEVADATLPANHYWASGDNIVIVAKDGNEEAARTGAKAIDGEIHNGQ